MGASRSTTAKKGAKEPLVEVDRRRLHPTAPEGATVSHARLSPDRERLAYCCDDGASFGIYVGAIESAGRSLVSLGTQEVDDLQWSPDGTLLSYVVGRGLPTGFEREVGWVAADTGEGRRVNGAACAWTPKGKLVVADLREREMVQIDPKTGRTKRLADLFDDGAIAFPTRIAVASSGKHIAYTCRRGVNQLSEVFVLSRTGKEEPQLVTQVPGVDVHILPFWSPKGKSLGLHIVHRAQDKSGLILIPHLRGDGIILHDQQRIDPPYTPAWSVSGRYVACWLADAMGIHLELFDTAVRGRGAGLTLGGGIPIGYPRFDGKRLVVDGGLSAEVITLSREV